MKRRSIRLKERAFNNLRIHTPSEEYYQIRPFLNRKSYFEQTDELGVIKSELSVKSVDKVLLMGGSFVENMFVDSNKRIASCFEKKINSLGYNIQVINAGVSGATSLNLFNALLNKFLILRPKVLFFFIPTNDGICLDLKGGLWNLQKSYSNLYNVDFRSEVDTNGSDQKIQDIVHLYQLLFEVCNLFNIDLYICASPIVRDITNFFLVPEVARSEMNNNRDLVVDSILALSAIHNIKTIDFREIFPNLKEMFFDDVHTNELGSENISEGLLQRFLGSDLLNKLVQSTSFTYHHIQIFDRIALDKITIWSDSIKVDREKTQDVVLTFNMKCNADVTIKNALFVVNFSGKTYSYEECGLYTSPHVGNFNYLLTRPSVDCTLHYSFTVPVGVSSILIGFRLWGDIISEIIVENSEIYIRNSIRKAEIF